MHRHRPSPGSALSHFRFRLHSALQRVVLAALFLPALSSVLRAQTIPTYSWGEYRTTNYTLPDFTTSPLILTLPNAPSTDSQQATQAGILSGAGSVSKNGFGTLVLAGDNTYSGVTYLTGGTLQIGNGGSTGSVVSQIVMDNNSALKFNRSDIYTHSGRIAGTGSLVFNGSGTLVLSGNNEYTGSTTVSSGTLALGSLTALPTTTRLVLGASATFRAEGISQQIGSLEGSGNIILDDANSTFPGYAGTLTTGADNSSTTFSGVISGTGGLTKRGTGTFTLSGANTHTGTTTINNGTLALGADHTLSDSTRVTVYGTLDMADRTETIGSLEGSAAGRVILRSGTLTTGGDNTSTAFAGVISSDGPWGFLTKAGTGTFTLSGANTYGGGTIVSAGTLQLGTGGSLFGTAYLGVSSGATFDLNGRTQTIAQLYGAGTITLGAGTLTTHYNDASSFSGVISGTGNLTKTGTGTTTLSGANTYTGTTTVSAGTLALGADHTLSDSSSVILEDGTTLDLLNHTETIGSLAGEGSISLGTGALTTGANDSSTTFVGVISGVGPSSSLTKTGTGTLTLSGANTYGGVTTISGGTLQLGEGGTTGSVASDIVNNGALVFNRSDHVTFGHNISGSGSVTKSGSGTLALTNTSTYSGTTTIAAGTLTLDWDGAMPRTTALTVASGATFDLNNVTKNVGSLAGEGRVILGSGSLTTGANNTSTTFAGVLSGSGSLTKVGTGTFTLSGANTYTGATTVSVGTVTLGATGSLADTTTLAVASGATFDLNGRTQTVSSLTGSGTVTLGSGTLSTGGNDSFTFGGVLSGTGGFTKAGSGTTTLSGANTYTGATTVSVGTLTLGATGSLADTTTLAVASEATFDLNHRSHTIGSLTGSGNLTLGSGSLTAGGNDASSTFDGIISGTGSFIKAGTGTTTLSAANTYTGATTVSAGTLTLGADNILSDSTAVSLASGTVLNLNHHSDTIGSLTGSGNITLGSGTLTTGGDDTSSTFGGVLSGTGGFTKAGTGTTTLTGTNTYAGATTVSGGTLQIGDGSTNGSLGATAITLTSENASVVFNRSDDSTFAGLIEGRIYDATYDRYDTGGTLTKRGAGTLTLTRPAAEDPATRFSVGLLDLQGGTLALAPGLSGEAAYFSLGSAPATLSGGSFRLNNTITVGGVGGDAGYSYANEQGTPGQAGTTGTTGNLTLADGIAVTSRFGYLNIGSSGGYGEESYTVGVNGARGGDGGAGTLTLTGAGTSLTMNVREEPLPYIDGNFARIGGDGGMGAYAEEGSVGGRGGDGGQGTLALGADTHTQLGLSLQVGGHGAGSYGTQAGGNGGRGSVTLGAGASLTINSGDIFVGGNDGVNDGGTASVGLGAEGSIVLGDGAQLSATGPAPSSLSIGGNAAGTVTLGADASLEIFGNLTVGGAGTHADGGNGTLTLGTRAVAAVGQEIQIGGGGGEAQTNRADPALGRNGANGGAGNLTLGDSASLTAPTITIGGFGGDGGFGESEHLTGGVGGAGTLTVASGASLTVSSLTIGGGVNPFASGGSGTLNLGAGTLTVQAHVDPEDPDYVMSPEITITSTGTFNVGYDGTAATAAPTLTLAAGTTITNEGTINLRYTSGTANFDNATITGSGTIRKFGAGTLVVTSPNDSATAVAGGTLRSGTDHILSDSARLSVDSGATFDLNNHTETVGSLAGTGNITLGSGALTTGEDGSSSSYSGVISGTGTLTKTGAGTFTLTSDHTYLGNTTVTAGTLANNGSLVSTVIVNADAILGGAGTFAGRVTLESGAHLAPGNSPGTVTFTHGLTLNAGTILDFELGTISDRIHLTGGPLTGPGTIGSLILNLSDAGGFQAGTYTLINYTTASGTTGFGADSFAFGSTIAGYTYQLTNNSGLLQLTATASAIPEPSTYAVIFGALALVGAAVRRRLTVKLKVSL